jgi:hypothetical protein
LSHTQHGVKDKPFTLRENATQAKFNLFANIAIGENHLALKIHGALNQNNKTHVHFHQRQFPRIEREMLQVLLASRK